MKQENSNKKTLKIVTTAICLALAMVLPFLTGNIPQIGRALSPMHIPILLCGFLAGPYYAVLIGFISPVLRFFLFGMPPIYPTGFAMCCELATYGLISGLMYRRLPKKAGYIYLSLITAMLLGRIVWGAASVILLGFGESTFTWSAFISGALLNVIPGIVVQIILIPAIVIALRKTGVLEDSGFYRKIDANV